MGEKKVIFETESEKDHKSQNEKEKARIESMGRVVRSQSYEDSIFIKGKITPALQRAER